MISLYENLGEPGPVEKGALRVLPLGGLGEVGRNMTVLETKGKLLIVDCGVLFPNNDQPGVDLVLPDFGYVEDRVGDLVALVLTHGHEDHIGAVPYLLKLKPDLPVYGSKFTIALLKAKLAEHRISAKHLRVIEENEQVNLAPFEVIFVAVSHSIPDAMAVHVKTAAGTVLLTGDFKIDPLPLDGRLTDIRTLGRLGEEGVDLLLIDSTNAEVPGFVAPEANIGPVLRDVFAQTPGQVVVATFASHVARVQQVVNAAAQTGRLVAFAGRSMERNMAIAKDLGYIEAPEGVIADFQILSHLPDSERAYMVTGSQGEPMAALGRIASGRHPKIKVGPGDTVVFASSAVPGNEEAISKLINNLTRRGVRVVHKDNADVHVSGHAYSGEILYMYNVVQPKNSMPFHGEIRHLVANGGLAVKTGIPAENVVLADSGVAVDLKDGQVSVAGVVPNELVFVDGQSVGEVSKEHLEERALIGSEGMITVYAVVDKESGMVLADPVVKAVGMAETPASLAEVEPLLAEALKEAAAPGNVPPARLQQVLRRTLGRWVSRSLRRKPKLVPVVVEQ